MPLEARAMLSTYQQETTGVPLLGELPSLEDTAAASTREGIPLQVQVLVVGRDMT